MNSSFYVHTSFLLLLISLQQHEILASTTTTTTTTTNNITIRGERRKLTSKEIGPEHNRICLQLGERLKQKTPTSKEDYFQYVQEEMTRGLCSSNNDSCHSHIQQDIMEAQQEDYLGRDYETLLEDLFMESESVMSENSGSSSIFLDLFDNVNDKKEYEDLKDMLRNIYNTVLLLREGDYFDDEGSSDNDNFSDFIQDIITDISQMANEYERQIIDSTKEETETTAAAKETVERRRKSRRVAEWKKHVVSSAASVAIASTELWTSVLFDPESGFYQKGFDSSLSVSDVDGGERRRKTQIIEFNNNKKGGDEKNDREDNEHDEGYDQSPQAFEITLIKGSEENKGGKGKGDKSKGDKEDDRDRDRNDDDGDDDDYHSQTSNSIDESSSGGGRRPGFGGGAIGQIISGSSSSSSGMIKAIHQTISSDIIGAVRVGLSPILVSTAIGGDDTQDLVESTLSAAVVRSVAAFLDHFPALSEKDEGEDGEVLVMEPRVDDDDDARYNGSI